MRPAELDRAAADFRQSLDAMNDATIRAIRVAQQILEPFRCTPGPEGAGPAPRVTLSSRAGEPAMQFTSALPGRTDPAAVKAAGSPFSEVDDG